MKDLKDVLAQLCEIMDKRYASLNSSNSPNFVAHNSKVEKKEKINPIQIKLYYDFKEQDMDWHIYIARIGLLGRAAGMGIEYPKSDSSIKKNETLFKKWEF